MANLGAEDQMSEESEDMSSDEEATEDLDSVDGLKNFLKKNLVKFASRLRIKKRTAPESFEPPSIPSTDFSEGKDKTMNNTYEFNYPRRGLALIIDNEHFQPAGPFSDRPGSSCDSRSLKKTFNRLGFDVMMLKDLSSKAMYQTLTSASQDYNHAAADCFVCVILSHGHEIFIQKENSSTESYVHVRQDIIFGVNGKALATEKILNIFNDSSCPGLAGKPRIFFFQACRGENLDEGVLVHVTKEGTVKNQTKPGRDAHDGLNSQMCKGCDGKVMGLDSQEDFTDALSGSDDEREEDVHGAESDVTDARTGEQTPVVITPAALYKDCLVMYATPPGYYAWRRTSGSWFIESLCRVLNCKETRCKSLINALVQVCRRVAQNYESNTPRLPEMHERKEMPVIQSMLVKDIVMTKKAKNLSLKFI